MRRTAVVNQIRSLLPERGLTLPKGRSHVISAYVLTPHSIVCSGEDPVQICRCTDEREMRKCLRKIPKMSAVQSKLL